MADRLVRARAEFLRATLGPVMGLDRTDVATSFRGVSAGLLQARMTARAVAVDTVIDRGRDQLARAIGVDLGWEFVDRSRWLGPDVRAAFAARLAGTADWLAAQQAAGVDPEALVARVTYWQQQVAGSDVHRVAREATLEVAGGNPAMGRVMRVAEPDACDWCEAMATRAAAYYSEDTALAAGHANCQCDVETVTDPRMVTYLREQGAIAWQRSGLVGQPILRGQRAARFPRTDPQLTAPGAATPQRLAAIDAQLAGYEQVLAAGRGTDWMRAQVTALRTERRALAETRPRPPAAASGVKPQRSSPAQAARGSAYPEPIGDGPPLPFTAATRPRIRDDIQVQGHILEGHANQTSTATLFPPTWQADPQLIWEAVDAVLGSPGTVRWSAAHLTFYGTHNGVRMVVQMLRSSPSRIHTAYPVDGRGVTRAGRPVELPPEAYRGVRWLP